MEINYLRLKEGDIVDVKDSVVGTKLKVIAKLDDRFIKLVDSKKTILVIIEVISKDYKRGNKSNGK